jgi:hypothetical protein
MDNKWDIKDFEEVGETTPARTPESAQEIVEIIRPVIESVDVGGIFERIAELPTAKLRDIAREAVVSLRLEETTFRTPLHTAPAAIQKSKFSVKPPKDLNPVLIPENLRINHMGMIAGKNTPEGRDADTALKYLRRGNKERARDVELSLREAMEIFEKPEKIRKASIERIESAKNEVEAEIKADVDYVCARLNGHRGTFNPNATINNVGKGDPVLIAVAPFGHPEVGKVCEKFKVVYGTVRETRTHHLGPRITIQTPEGHIVSTPWVNVVEKIDLIEA